MDIFSLDVQLIVMYLDGSLVTTMTDSMTKCVAIGEMLARDDNTIINWICEVKDNG